MEQLDFHMALAVLGAFLFFQFMKKVKRRSKRDDRLDDSL